MKDNGFLISLEMGVWGPQILMIPWWSMFKAMVSLFHVIMTTSYSLLGSLHTYCTLEHTLMTSSIQYLYTFANDHLPMHGSSFIILALKWMMTTHVPFLKMYGMTISHGLVHSTHLNFSYSIIWLISSIHHCTSSHNCAYSSICNSLSSSYLVMHGMFPCSKGTHCNMWIKASLKFSINHWSYSSRY
jgi:hypothetical protein